MAADTMTATTPPNFELLAAALEDGELPTRIRAAQTLGRLRDPEAVAALNGVVTQGANPNLLVAVAHALGAIHDPSSLPSLIRLSNSYYVMVRVEAIAALQYFNDPTATAAIREGTEDVNVVVRREAERVLKLLSSPDRVA